MYFDETALATLKVSRNSFVDKHYSMDFNYASKLIRVIQFDLEVKLHGGTNIPVKVCNDAISIKLYLDQAMHISAYINVSQRILGREYANQGSSTFKSCFVCLPHFCDETLPSGAIKVYNIAIATLPAEEFDSFIITQTRAKFVKCSHML